MKDKAIAWVEYVLPIWEAYYPEDDRPRKALEAAKTDNDVRARARAAYAASDDNFVGGTSFVAIDVAYIAARVARASDVNYVDADAENWISVANLAARAIIRGNYGKEDEVSTINLLLTKYQQEDIANKIEWLNHNPEDVWVVLKNMYVKGDK